MEDEPYDGEYVVLSCAFDLERALIEDSGGAGGGKVWAACIPGEASRSKSADAVGAEARRRPKRIVDGRLGGRRRIRNDVGSVDGAPAGESVAHAPLLLSSGRRA